MRHKKNNIINIRSIFQTKDSIHNLQHEIESTMDRRLAQFLYNKVETEITIIVGKGHNSDFFIEGKNPLRYYVENYLRKMNITFKDGDYHNGQEGVIIIYL